MGRRRSLLQLGDCIAAPESSWNKFVELGSWRYAKTMPQWPHEYVVRRDCHDEGVWEWAVAFIRLHGVKERFGAATRPYLYRDGWKYWTMGAPVSETIIINREVATPSGEEASA